MVIYVNHVMALIQCFVDTVKKTYASDGLFEMNSFESVNSTNIPAKHEAAASKNTYKKTPGSAGLRSWIGHY